MHVVTNLACPFEIDCRVNVFARSVSALTYIGHVGRHACPPGVAFTAPTAVPTSMPTAAPTATGGEAAAAAAAAAAAVAAAAGHSRPA
jgi:hypothetical protein